MVLGTLRQGDGGLDRCRAAVSEAYVPGVGWHALFAGTGARAADLPTYPFERQRFWPFPGDRTAPRHPLLESETELAGGDRAAVRP